jgi:hypothetical protein
LILGHSGKDITEPKETILSPEAIKKIRAINIAKGRRAVAEQRIKNEKAAKRNKRVVEIKRTHRLARR